ncbi:MAG TPA: helix-hairpin-helix domain-containing protein [Phycisphaerae bacterium]|nr:helix-hairpin-helix domain-containing protein [Phycisphaerae bacterium]
MACYVLLGGLLAWTLLQHYLRPLVLEEGIGAAGSHPADEGLAPSAEAGPIEQRIDPNTASWAELTRLPRIGEVTAKRIVEYREAHRDRADESAADAPVFRRPEDLERVPGIGPVTVERIAPYLRFPESPEGIPD